MSFIVHWWCLRRPWMFLLDFLALDIDQSVSCTSFLLIFVEFWRLLKNDLVDGRIWCQIINFWRISFNIDPLCFLNISAYPELKEDHFGAKKSLKSQLIKILEHFFWKPILFFLGQSFEKFWFSKPVSDPELSNAIVEKKSPGYSQKWVHSSHFSVFWKNSKGTPLW